MARIGAQIHLMMSPVDRKGLCKFARTGAEPTDISEAAASLHQFDSSLRFNCANQNEPVRIAFHQHVQHPVNAIIKIDVRCARLIPLNKAARAWSRKGVRSFIIGRRVRFDLYDSSGALAPNQFSADELTRARKRIALKKNRGD